MAGRFEENANWDSARVISIEQVESNICEEAQKCDEQKSPSSQNKLDVIYKELQASKHFKRFISIKMVDEYEQLHVVGIVEEIDFINFRYKVDGEWFKLKEIEHISSCSMNHQNLNTSSVKLF